GNVGIGTTSPAQSLHVVGQCMTGDTLIAIRRRKRKRKKKNGEQEDEELDTDGYEYLYVPIRNIMPEDEVLSLNEDTNRTEYKKVNALMDMGTKEIYEIRTKSGRVIRTTGNHPYLVKLRQKQGKKFNPFITFAKKTVNFFKTRDIEPIQNREIETPAPTEEKIPMSIQADVGAGFPRPSVLEIFCPYCSSQNFVKRGLRQKKMEKVQLYLCSDCSRTFTPGSTKGKHYPLEVILDAISLYNLGHSLEAAAKIASRIHLSDAKELQPSSLLNWLNQYKDLCIYSRMRPFALKMFKPEDVISSATLAHRQLYRFRHHRAKTQLIIREDIKHSRFGPLKEFLDLIPAECPHQYFQDGLRASEAPMCFSKKEMIVRSKQNYANKLAKFVLGSVHEAKDRHDALQRFMLANDTVTVATEVPIYLRKQDLAHMQTQLGFEMYHKKTRNQKTLIPFPPEELPRLITGHIDMIQIRNGAIHILDYKPNASKERPLEQLTLYALALSRLTGLRVFNFKCAWFDEKNYYEFYPLHIVYKPKRKRQRQKIATLEGTYRMNKDPCRVENLEPG
ncbi:PD-(D/E)XK nuclease family protein, partial [Patescibacteria group bacterium]|nr:PD-(D/E)XK nuclease family protein [Patescibacteria group bacterium]